jgi:hypothetical protein
MSEAPKRISVDIMQTEMYLGEAWEWSEGDEMITYIRADLVEKLIAEYSGHKGSCAFWDEGYDESDCTCGYFRLIRDLTLTN